MRTLGFAVAFALVLAVDLPAQRATPASDAASVEVAAAGPQRRGASRQGSRGSAGSRSSGARSQGSRTVRPSGGRTSPPPARPPSAGSGSRTIRPSGSGTIRPGSSSGSRTIRPSSGTPTVRPTDTPRTIRPVDRTGSGSGSSPRPRYLPPGGTARGGDAGDGAARPDLTPDRYRPGEPTRSVPTPVGGDDARGSAGSDGVLDLRPATPRRRVVFPEPYRPAGSAATPRRTVSPSFEPRRADAGRRYGGLDVGSRELGPSGIRRRAADGHAFPAVPPRRTADPDAPRRLGGSGSIGYRMGPSGRLTPTREITPRTAPEPPPRRLRPGRGLEPGGGDVPGAGRPRPGIRPTAGGGRDHGWTRSFEELEELGGRNPRGREGYDGAGRAISRLQDASIRVGLGATGGIVPRVPHHSPGHRPHHRPHHGHGHGHHGFCSYYPWGFGHHCGFGFGFGFGFRFGHFYSSWGWPYYVSSWYPLWYTFYRPYYVSYPVYYSTVVYSAAEEPAEEVVYVDEPVGEAVAQAVEEPAPEATPAEMPESLSIAAERYLTLGDRAFREGRYTDAVQFYAKAVEFAPGEAALHLVLADALFAAGDYHYAAFSIRRALELDPRLVEIPVDKHEFYTVPEEFDRHLAVLETYLEDRPEDRDARLVLATNYLFGDRPAAAVDLLEGQIAPSTARGRDPVEALVLEAARHQQHGPR